MRLNYSAEADRVDLFHSGTLAPAVSIHDGLLAETVRGAVAPNFGTLSPWFGEADYRGAVRLIPAISRDEVAWFSVFESDREHIFVVDGEPPTMATLQHYMKGSWEPRETLQADLASEFFKPSGDVVLAALLRNGIASISGNMNARCRYAIGSGEDGEKILIQKDRYFLVFPVGTRL
jgi:hypothetical protein